MDTAEQSADDTREWPVGAHLVTPRRGYFHHGIYVGHGRVVHYSGFSRGWRRGPVEEVPVAAFGSGREVTVCDTRAARHHGEACAERARQRLGEDRFSLWNNNCEHFSNWCAHGVGRSSQIDAIRERISAIWSLVGRRSIGAPNR